MKMLIYANIFEEESVSNKLLDKHWVFCRHLSTVISRFTASRLNNLNVEWKMENELTLQIFVLCPADSVVICIGTSKKYSNTFSVQHEQFFCV